MDEPLTIRGTSLVPGTADGLALASDVPISFWGGVDPDRGTVIDQRHPWVGERISGRVLVLPQGRGSCSASGVFLESVANGVGPSAVVVSSPDPVIGLGAVLVDELLGRQVPVVLVAEADRIRIRTGQRVAVEPDGTLTVGPPARDVAGSG